MYVCIFLSVSLIIYILFAVCTTTTVQYSNQGINIKSRIRVLNCYYANKFILKSCIIYCRIYGVIIFLIGVFPIHDDHCKLTLTTSTSSFVSRTFFLSLLASVDVLTKNCIRLLLLPTYFFLCLLTLLLFFYQELIR